MGSCFLNILLHQKQNPRKWCLVDSGWPWIHQRLSSNPAKYWTSNESRTIPSLQQGLNRHPNGKKYQTLPHHTTKEGVLSRVIANLAKTSKKRQSLRLQSALKKLTWYFCPKTPVKNAKNKTIDPCGCIFLKINVLIQERKGQTINKNCYDDS